MNVVENEDDEPMLDYYRQIAFDLRDGHGDGL